MRHAAGLRQRPGFTFTVVRGVEHHWNRARGGIEAQLLDQLIAVHHRHEHIGNHQIRVFGPGKGQADGAVGGFEQPMALRAQQQHQHQPVHGEVVDDEYGRHVLF
jgi:hypothetical protein